MALGVQNLSVKKLQTVMLFLTGNRYTAFNYDTGLQISIISFIVLASDYDEVPVHFCVLYLLEIPVIMSI